MVSLIFLCLQKYVIYFYPPIILTKQIFNDKFNDKNYQQSISKKNLFFYEVTTFLHLSYFYYFCQKNNT